MKVTRHLLRSGKYNKFSSIKKRGASIDVVKEPKVKRVNNDPRYRNIAEDLEGLTEGERKL